MSGYGNDEIGIGGISLIIMSLAVIFLLVFFAATYSVSTGTAGVFIQFQKVSGLAEPGLNFLIPFAQRIVPMSTQVQALQINNEYAQSFDLQQINTSTTVNFQISSQHVLWIYSQLGTDYWDSIILPIQKEDFKAVVANYTAEQLITERPRVIAEMQNVLQASLNKYNITVNQISVTNFTFSKNFSQAIEAKVTANQTLLKEKIQVDIARQIANQSIAMAEGNATARIIQANATARAAAIIQSAIASNPAYLQYLMISEWNGHTPLVVGSNAAPLLNLNASLPILPAVARNSSS